MLLYANAITVRQAATELYHQSAPQDVEGLLTILATPPIYQDPARPDNHKGSETVVSMVAALTDARSGEAVLHVARGRGGDSGVPVVKIAVPSLLAPLPYSLPSFAALSAVSAAPLVASAAGVISKEQEENFHRDGFVLLKGFCTSRHEPLMH